MKAAILAAGCATRLPDDRPKTLLPVAGVPILRRAMTSLIRCGVDQLVIGTGHREQQVRDAVAAWFPGLDVAFVTNPSFRATGNACSLALLRPHLDGRPFFLLDGDVVFDVDVVSTLLDHGPDCLAVRSVGALGLEEVKVAADKDDRVVAIGKHVPVRGAMGEAVGVTLCSADTSRRLFAALDGRLAAGRTHELYEAALQQLVDGGTRLRGVDLGTLYATEIDTLDDLGAADRHLEAQPAFNTRVGFRLAV